jgi:hypothetical protein
MNDKLIKEAKIWENLFEFKRLDGKLLDGDVLLFNYKFLELFVSEYIDILHGRANNFYTNHVLEMINSEIDRFLYAISDKYHTSQFLLHKHIDNVRFFKDLCNKNIASKETLNKNETLTKAKEILDSRQEKGIKTYGTTLDDANLSDKELLNHAIEEVADLFLYLTKLKNNG